MKARLALAFALSALLAALAQNLTQVYQDARAYDAQYAAARYALQAGLEKLPHGRALVLPTLNLSASVVQTYLDSEFKGPTTQPAGQRDYRTDGYTFTLTQPLYRPQNLAQYNQGEVQAKQAESVFGQAPQDLIVRVAVAYFEMLGAQDSLADQPDALAYEIIGQQHEPACMRIARIAERLAQREHTLTLLSDAGFGALIGVDQALHELVADSRRHAGEQALRLRVQTVDREPHAQTELPSVFEQRVRPRGAAAVGVGRIGSGRQIPGVDRRAPRGVRDQRTIAEQLGEQLELRGLAASGTRARVLEQGLEELRRLHVEVLECARRLGQPKEERIVLPLGLAQRRLGSLPIWN